MRRPRRRKAAWIAAALGLVAAAVGWRLQAGPIRVCPDDLALLSFADRCWGYVWGDVLGVVGVLLFFSACVYLVLGKDRFTEILEEETSIDLPTPPDDDPVI